MAYKVRLTRPAEADAYAAYECIREDAPAAAERWLHGLFHAVFSLEDMPTRCPLIPEADEFGVEIWHLLYGKRSGIHRIIFDIEESSDEGARVRVLRIWHGARDRIRIEDLEDESTEDKREF